MDSSADSGPRPRLVAVLAAVAFVALAVFLVTRCGGSASTFPAGPKPPLPTLGPTSTAPRPRVAPGSTMAQLRSAGKIVIGVKFDQPAFGYKDPKSGRIDGFDVAVAFELARSMGLKPDQVQFIQTVSQDRIPALQQGRVDLVLATMSITPEREAQVDMSRPYFLAGQSILVRNGTDDITTPQSLNGKRVCTVLGSTSESTIAQLAPQAMLLSLDAYGPCVDALRARQVDAVTTDDSILAGFAEADDSLKLVGSQFTRELYGVGIRKGRDDLRDFVNEVINDMLADGTWDRIYTRYLGGVRGMPPAAAAHAALPG